MQIKFKYVYIHYGLRVRFTAYRLCRIIYQHTHIIYPHTFDLGAFVLVSREFHNILKYV